MYYAQPTWLEFGPVDGAVKGLCGPRRRARRGVGDTCYDTSSGNGFDCTTGLPVPPAASPAAASGSTCFTPAFPWLGSSSAGVCVPVFSVPAPWGIVVSAGLAALVAFKLFGGRR